MIRQHIDSYWKIYDDVAILINQITILIGLISFFNQQKIRFYIYLGPAENYIWTTTVGDDERFMFLQKQAGILDFTKFNMLDLTNHQVHPNEDGMKLIADYFINLLGESV